MTEIIEMDEQIDAGMSPRPHKKDEPKAFLNFYDALKEVSLGKKITRADWQDANCYGYMR